MAKPKTEIMTLDVDVIAWVQNGLTEVEIAVVLENRGHSKAKILKVLEDIFPETDHLVGTLSQSIKKGGAGWTDVEMVKALSSVYEGDEESVGQVLFHGDTLGWGGNRRRLTKALKAAGWSQIRIAKAF